VKEELLSRVRPKRLQGQIVVGYHNAGEIGALNDDAVPPKSSELDSSLSSVNEAINGSDFLSRHSRKEAKGKQITLEASSPLVLQDLWECTSDIVRRNGEPGVRLVQSTHSIDVLAPGVSKRSLLSEVIDRLRESHGEPRVLCIGDRGRWPGNDFELLQHPFALSVDQTSQDPATCWNIAPPGTRFVGACLYYARHFEIDSGSFRITGLTEKTR
jgi:hypothetical protein